MKPANKKSKLKVKHREAKPRSVGRPTKFDEAMIEQVEKLCMLGATDKDLADFFDVAESTINEWKLNHPEFSESIKRGKVIADSNVANSLYKRATGYEHPEDDIKAYEGEIIITPTIKHYPPDPTSMIFWLKNRSPRTWRDKQEVDLSNSDGTLKPIQIIAVTKETVDEISKLK